MADSVGNDAAGDGGGTKSIQSSNDNSSNYLATNNVLGQHSSSHLYPQYHQPHQPHILQQQVNKMVSVAQYPPVTTNYMQHPLQEQRQQLPQSQQQHYQQPIYSPIYQTLQQSSPSTGATNNFNASPMYQQPICTTNPVHVQQHSSSNHRLVGYNSTTLPLTAVVPKNPQQQQPLVGGVNQHRGGENIGNVQNSRLNPYGSYQVHPQAPYQFQTIRQQQPQLQLQSISKLSPPQQQQQQQHKPFPLATMNENMLQYQGPRMSAAANSVTNNNSNNSNSMSNISNKSSSMLPGLFTSPIRSYNHHHISNHHQQNNFNISPNVSASGGSSTYESTTTATTNPASDFYGINNSSSNISSNTNRWSSDMSQQRQHLDNHLPLSNVKGSGDGGKSHRFTSQRLKLVENTSNGSSPSGSDGDVITNGVGGAKTSGDGKFKTYLTHLVLSSNIPFAYAITLVAFLITIIAATSIITVLTIILTITGYTAYPITESTFNTSLVIGVVCASFALALVVFSLIIWRRHCQAAYYYLDDPQSISRGTNSPQLSETYDDTEYGSVPVSDWAKHVQRLHADSDIGFSREFEQIQQATNNASFTYEHSQLPENKHKNRYINIVAYDHTRVTLRPIAGQKKPGSDYINANFIDVSIKFNITLNP